MTTLEPGPVHATAVDPTAVTPGAVGFDPTDPAFIADPYPVYARLRADHPVLWNPDTGQYLISRFRDVNALLRDRRLGRTYLHVATHAEMGRADDPAWHDPFWMLVRDGMLDREPPDHTRLRRLVSKAFTPRTVADLRPRIEAIVEGLLDAARRARRVRPHPRRRRAPAGHGHRGAAGRPRTRTATCSDPGRPTSA